MNVLFLMADELSWWGVGYARKGAKTPNIDRLAERARRFSSAYTPSPICVSARAAVACGQLVHRLRIWSSAEAYDGSPPSWGHKLAAAGILATSIGKLHYRSAEDDTGFAEEIEAVHVPGNGRGWVRGLLRQPACSYDATAELAEMIGPGDSSYQAYDRLVADRVVDWITNAPDTPWATFVSFLSPHYPLIAPPEFYDLYDPETLESEAEQTPDHPILREIAGFLSHDAHFTAKTRGIARAGYLGLCSFLDAQVGRVLDALEARGLAEETMVIFTSDHGEMLGEKGFWTKSNMYDSAVRVPLLLAGPDITPGDCDTPVNLTDIAPSICNALGAAHDMPGVDLRGLIPKARTVISEYHDGGASVGLTMARWNEGPDRWKLVHYAEGQPPQLFNLTDDPKENINLAPSHQEVVARGMVRMAAQVDPEKANAQAHADRRNASSRSEGATPCLRNPNGTLPRLIAGETCPIMFPQMPPLPASNSTRKLSNPLPHAPTVPG